MDRAEMPWDYRVIGININPIKPPDAKKSAERLGESFSPEFLKDQFPEEYQTQRSVNMALQCQKVIRIYGKHGWEHYQQGQLGSMAMLYFRRRAAGEVNAEAKLTAEEEAMIAGLDPLQRP